MISLHVLSLALRVASPSSLLTVLSSAVDSVDADGTVEMERTVHVPGNDKAVTQLQPVRVVCLSDTHGFERCLQSIPHGDILLHCGDYALDGKPVHSMIAHNQFDEFLAAQPHRVKVVLRGNHDPPNAKFPLSKAIYVSPSESIAVHDFYGLRFAFCPYPSRGVLRSSMTPCDVLVSHEPPKGVLDVCRSGESVGSQVLTDAAASLTVPPRLWVFGHIHESRGSACIQLNAEARGLIGLGSSNLTTTCINAASANTGLATALLLVTSTS